METKLNDKFTSCEESKRRFKVVSGAKPAGGGDVSEVSSREDMDTTINKINMVIDGIKMNISYVTDIISSITDDFLNVKSLVNKIDWVIFSKFCEFYDIKSYNELYNMFDTIITKFLEHSNSYVLTYKTQTRVKSYEAASNTLDTLKELLISIKLFGNVIQSVDESFRVIINQYNDKSIYTQYDIKYKNLFFDVFTNSFCSIVETNLKQYSNSSLEDFNIDVFTMNQIVRKFHSSILSNIISSVKNINNKNLSAKQSLVKELVKLPEKPDNENNKIESMAKNAKQYKLRENAINNIIKSNYYESSLLDESYDYIVNIINFTKPPVNLDIITSSVLNKLSIHFLPSTYEFDQDECDIINNDNEDLSSESSKILLSQLLKDESFKLPVTPVPSSGHCVVSDKQHNIDEFINDVNTEIELGTENPDIVASSISLHSLISVKNWVERNRTKCPEGIKFIGDDEIKFLEDRYQRTIPVDFNNDKDTSIGDVNSVATTPKNDPKKKRGRPRKVKKDDVTNKNDNNIFDAIKYSDTTMSSMLMSLGRGVIVSSGINKKINEFSAATWLANYFASNLPLNFEHNHYISSFLFQIMDSERFNMQNTFHINIAKAISVSYKDSPDMGFDVWTEMIVQKRLIKLIKDWSVQNEVIPPNFDNNKTVSDRKWLAWMLRKHGNGFKHLKKISKSSMSDIKLDRARYPDNSTDFMDDFYYQCNSNNISTSIERFFSELYNDPFTKRVFASFVYIMPETIYKRYNLSIGDIIYAYGKFRESYFNMVKSHHGSIGGIFSLGMDNDILLNQNLFEMDDNASNITDYLEVTTNNNKQKFISDKISKTVTPNDYRWSKDQEINCALMFFHSLTTKSDLSGGKTLAESIIDSKKIKRDRISAKSATVEKIYTAIDSNDNESFANLFSDDKIDETFNNFILEVSNFNNQSDINEAVETIINGIKAAMVSAGPAVRSIWDEVTSIKHGITFKTLGSYANEDLPSCYTNWHENWCNSSLDLILKKEEHLNIITSYASRMFWQLFICVPKPSVGGNASMSVNWYLFEPNGHYLKTVNGGHEIITYIVDNMIPSLRNMAINIEELYKICEDKITFLESRNKMEPSEYSFVFERYKYYEAMKEAIKSLIVYCSKYSRIIQAISTSKLIQCINFSDFENKDAELMGFENGVVELGKHKAYFRSGKIEDYITKSTKINMPYGGDIKSKSPRYDMLHDDHPDVKFFDEYMSMVFVNEEIRKYMIKDFASYLYGRNSEKRFRIYFGRGNNSKSIIVKIFQEGFGDYCVDLPPEVIADKQVRNASGPCPELADAAGTRIAVMAEPSQNMKFDGGMIKKQTGGDRFRARKLNENGGSIIATYKLILCCNDPPDMVGTDEAVRNRMFMAPFESRWVRAAPASKEEQFNLKQFQIDDNFEVNVPKLARVLMWRLFHAYSTYKSEGLDPIPKHATDKLAEYWNSVDVYNNFVNERIDRNPYGDDPVEAANNTIKAKALYDVFTTWWLDCHPGARNVPSYPKFVQNVTRATCLGPFTVGAGNVTRSNSGWIGMRIITDVSDSSDYD